MLFQPWFQKYVLLTSYQGLVYDVLTALRGPDQPDPKDTLKKKTTIPVRRAVLQDWLTHPCSHDLHVRALNESPFQFVSRVAVDIQQQPAEDRNHFLWHYTQACRAIQQLREMDQRTKEEEKRHLLRQSG